jgi:hypothetical protein
VLLFHGDIDPMPLSESTGFVDERAGFTLS